MIKRKNFSIHFGRNRAEEEEFEEAAEEEEEGLCKPFRTKIVTQRTDYLVTYGSRQKRKRTLTPELLEFSY